MTPKEKAKELFDKYCFAIRTEETDSGYFTNVIYAKQCAIIAIDEIIKQWEYIDVYLADALGELNPNLKYWYEVKQEIEKL
jgi:hypothetical protein